LTRLPFGLGRQVARIRGRTVTVGGVVLAGVVVFVGVAVGLSVQHLLASRPNETGYWQGTIVLTNNVGQPLQTIAVGVQMVETQQSIVAPGNVRGVAMLCGSYFGGTTNAPMTYSISGATSTSSISIALTSSVDSFNFEGTSSATSLDLSGYYTRPSGVILQASWSMQKDTQPPGKLTC
jgi:hypothetical protein